MSTSLRNNAGPTAALGAFALLLGGIALAFYWVPNDADQGFSQRIFYIHVPVALTAYACFGWGAWKALRLLWTRDQRYDLESYTAIHMGVIFGVLTLVTGSIWARISWGVWWSWSEQQLVLFLVLFLFYSAYFMLRYSTDPGPRRANMSAVYALFGVVLIPVSFLAIRLAENFIHPVVFTRDGPQMEGTMFLTFCVCFAGVLALATALYQTELAGKRLDGKLRELRESALVTTSEKYVTAAYLVVLAVVLLYVVLYAFKMARLTRQIDELAELRAGRERLPRRRRPPPSVLVRLGSRGSRLALTQAELVAGRLREAESRRSTSPSSRSRPPATATARGRSARSASAVSSSRRSRRRSSPGGSTSPSTPPRT